VLGDKAAALPSSLCCKGVDTLSDLESASGLCNDYIEKVALLRDRLPPEVKSAVFTSDRNQCQNLEAPRGVFKFSLADHGSVVKIIYALKLTGALGLDGIPVSVLKLGTEVLASPMAHLINLSLASGKVPAAFKTALHWSYQCTRGVAKNGRPHPPTDLCPCCPRCRRSWSPL
jgi:hypothetical protein